MTLPRLFSGLIRQGKAQLSLSGRKKRRFYLRKHCFFETRGGSPVEATLFVAVTTLSKVLYVFAFTLFVAATCF